MKASTVGLIVLIASLVATSQLILRHGMQRFPGKHLSLSWHTLPIALSNPWIVTSMALGLVTFFAYAYLLTKVEVTFAAPAVNAVFYLLMFTAASVCLGERVTVSRVTGAAVLVVAMWLLTREAR